MKSLLIFFLVVLNILQIALTCSLSGEVNVLVINNLPSSTPPLRLNCASGDHEIGFHTLKVNEQFPWKFCMGLRTLFLSFVRDRNKKVLLFTKPDYFKNIFSINPIIFWPL
ncbi:hypothetical protein PHJA_002884800 [Phtheirospermum japonicum]|uniref:S-protein homolog n=1 Tax=Phtheirospermum japonicum TaxID=374723 RepID=A0A830D6S0_9LAMI|nr:hypothetical protein PHJA_002884800 [Phtheirospermum japonicum]